MMYVHVYKHPLGEALRAGQQRDEAASPREGRRALRGRGRLKGAGGQHARAGAGGPIHLEIDPVINILTSYCNHSVCVFMLWFRFATSV